ncbi:MULTISPECIES: VIT1/CCC1 transporter family protein [Lactiplantibacillus]|jgi:VIT1/CCC1 family predicted Fe2+/Mn2+ transporter|uniref:VIT family protein n=2 Tax=Lactiplantibacillus pentosus TaxID=1589 RepID=A0AAP5UMD2_LACPE|nr:MULTISPECIES: VIT family protein [Lactiplantibacillus]MBQ0837450.1 VIT family protein [Lactiplantibacillus pentosus]MBU7447859.1 VIT family protein [Lactiplantibacillus sp. 7.2.4]MBU7465145.1 VIT family protein [Lactiplantibacillus pentosus]MBU7480465.1 VIT family protein [Lactiplantibacillus pentosus]MBU7491156.1 VIT family protein [Lactiplantibacillus pentosus]
MQLTNTKTKKSKQTMDEKLNSLRAGVLGSNDGILTVVGVLFSVAAATTNQFTIFIAGLSDLLACAFSMASGEYASVSTQKDTEKAVVEKERQLLKTDFAGELHAVQRHYMNLGVTEATSLEIAKDLLSKKPLETVVRVKYDMELGHYMNPWDAAFASLFSASAGGVFPLFAMTFAPAHLQWPATIIAVSVAVALTGYLSAVLGKGNVKTAVIRNVIVGIITMFIHYYVGTLF